MARFMIILVVLESIYYFVHDILSISISIMVHGLARDAHITIIIDTVSTVIVAAAVPVAVVSSTQHDVWLAARLHEFNLKARSPYFISTKSFVLHLHCRTMTSLTRAALVALCLAGSPPPPWCTCSWQGT